MRLAFALFLLLLTAVPAPVAGADKAVDDLLFELQMVPLDGQVPAPFELERLGGGGTKVTLAEHRGRPVMLYFWATW
jgi:hypothetical protein